MWGARLQTESQRTNTEYLDRGRIILAVGGSSSAEIGIVFFLVPKGQTLNAENMNRGPPIYCQTLDNILADPWVMFCSALSALRKKLSQFWLVVSAPASTRSDAATTCDTSEIGPLLPEALR